MPWKTRGIDGDKYICSWKKWLEVVFEYLKDSFGTALFSLCPQALKL